MLAWERAAAAVSQREAVLLSALGRLTDGHGRLLTDVLRDKARGNSHRVFSVPPLLLLPSLMLTSARDCIPTSHSQFDRPLRGGLCESL